MKLVLLSIFLLIQLFFVNQQEISRNEKQKLFLIINAQYFKGNNDTLKIYHQRNLSSPAVKMTNEKIIFYKDTCSYNRNYCRYFNEKDVVQFLEYNIFYFKRAKEIKDGYLVSVGDDIYMIPHQNGVYTESIQKHIQGCIITPKPNVSLKQSPNTTSADVRVSKENIYFVVKVLNDWVLLETPEEFEIKERGWVKYSYPIKMDCNQN
ncbi:hypothetical protein [Flammeovirga sp. EKP202]|uniref:hypothetical protein n=1 Tax=Flammeovirga sp. EKP202 TaxID=2770592 RepID=UPI00165F2AA6|nr:hypothetical protein [Flammeovirga sp. EKP202]MBD0402956.1 hypothetical protein [Flammeovirga sp. EKP202]